MQHEDAATAARTAPTIETLRVVRRSNYESAQRDSGHADPQHLRCHDSSSLAAILFRRVVPRREPAVAVNDGAPNSRQRIQLPGQQQGQHESPSPSAAVEARATEGTATPSASNVTINHFFMTSSLGINFAGDNSVCRAQPCAEPTHPSASSHVPEGTFCIRDFRHMAVRPPGASLGGMLSRRELVIALPLSAAFLACKRDPAPESVRPREETESRSAALDPSESVDPAFDGCARSCALRSARDRAQARAQPGANKGDAVFCPVSGAVFRVGDDTPRRVARGHVLFFCCEACAAFFSQHESEVLAKRGLA